MLGLGHLNLSGPEEMTTKFTKAFAAIIAALLALAIQQGLARAFFWAQFASSTGQIPSLLASGFLPDMAASGLLLVPLILLIPPFISPLLRFGHWQGLFVFYFKMLSVVCAGLLVAKHLGYAKSGQAFGPDYLVLISGGGFEEFSTWQSSLPLWQAGLAWLALAWVTSYIFPRLLAPLERIFLGVPAQRGWTLVAFVGLFPVLLYSGWPTNIQAQADLDAQARLHPLFGVYRSWSAQ